MEFTQLPAEAFRGWRGNVIRLDEGTGAMPDDATLRELGVPTENAPTTDAADRLVWFFEQIQRYGSPLIVWTRSATRHKEFLETAAEEARAFRQQVESKQQEARGAAQQVGEAVAPSPEERRSNPRARSARMRSAVRARD